MDDLPEDDTRAGRFPRFSEENFRQNLELADRVREIAAEKDATPGSSPSRGCSHQGDDIVPIPGTKRREHLEENAGGHVKLTEEDLEAHRGGDPARLRRRGALLRAADALRQQIGESG